MSYAYNEERMLEGIRSFRSEHDRAEEMARRVRHNVYCREKLPNQTLISVAKLFCLDPEKMLSALMSAELVRAREVVVFVLRRNGYSLPIIGRFLNRHHTTIHHSGRNAEIHYASDSAFREVADLVLGEVA